jgi:hypothetical protein
MSSPGGNKWQHQLPLRDELKNHLLVGHSCKYTPRTAAGFNTSNPQETSPKFPELSAVIMHIHMEMSLGTPCIATFTSNKQRCQFLLLSSTKLESMRSEQVMWGGYGKNVCTGM